MRKIHIGNVAVTDAACSNPYTYDGPMRSGPPRVLALAMFKHGRLTTGMALWEAPAMGGARRINAEDVDWATSGIP